MRGIWVHTLTQLDTEQRTALCGYCGPVRVHRALRPNGEYQYQCKNSKGVSSARARRNRGRKGVLEHCPRCRALIEHPCQLDVDHIVPKSMGGADTLENMQTLCANCHRLKTRLERAGQLPAAFMSTYPLTA